MATALRQQTKRTRQSLRRRWRRWRRDRVVSIGSAFDAVKLEPLEKRVLLSTVGAGGDFTTIQEAVNNATAGEVIMVADGTYNESVDLFGAPGNITIDAINDGLVNIISPSGPAIHNSQAFSFDINLDGRNLQAPNPDGLYQAALDFNGLGGSSYSITDTMITNSTEGIAIGGTTSAASFNFVNTTITDTDSGIDLNSNSSASFTFDSLNVTASNGGGLWNSSGTVTINGGMVTGNTADGSGGGIFNSGGTLTIDGGMIDGNNGVDEVLLLDEANSNNEEVVYLNVLALIPGDSYPAVLKQGDFYDHFDFLNLDFDPGSISNFVFNDLNANGLQDGGEPGVDGVVVNLFGTGNTVVGDGDDVQLSTTTTAGGGFYMFPGLAAGNYYITAEPVGFGVTQLNQGGDDTIDSDVDPATLRSDLVVLAAGENDNTVDVGLVQLETVLDLVPNLTTVDDQGNTVVRIIPGQSFDVDVRVVEASEPFSGFQLNFTQSGIAPNELSLSNWIVAPPFADTSEGLQDTDITDGFVSDSVPLFQGPLNLQDAPPMVSLGTFTVTAPNGSGVFTLTIDRVLGNDQDTLLSSGTFDSLPISEFGTLQISVDGIDPTVTVDPLITIDDTPTLTGTFEDNDQVDSVSVQLTGNNINQGPFNAQLDQQAGTWSVDGSLLAGLPFGTFEVLATATDRTGNTGNDNTNDELEVTDGPTVDFNQGNPLLTKDSTPDLSGFMSDPQGSVTIQINGQGPISAVVDGNTWSVAGSQINSLADGVYDVQVSALDASNNPGDDSTTNELTIDTIGPTVVATNPDDLAIINDDALTELTVQFADQNPIDQTSAEDLSNFQLLAALGNGEFTNTSQQVTIQSASFDPATKTTTLTLPLALDDDNFQLTYTGLESIEDAAGNPLNRQTEGGPGSNHVITFEVDTTAPQLISAQLAPDTGLFNDDFITNNQTPVLNLTFNEPIFGLPGDIFRSNLLPAVQQFTQGTTSITIAFDAPLVEGFHEINIKDLKDAAGNKIGPLLTSSIDFVVDLTAPTVQSILLGGENTLEADEVVSQITIQFNEQGGLDGTTVLDTSNYQLVEAGIDGVVGTIDDIALPGTVISIDSFNPLLRRVVLGFTPGIGADLDDESKTFGLIINGSASIKDLAGLTLDGNSDNDGNPGGDHVITFDIDTRGSAEIEGLVWDDDGDGIRQQNEAFHNNVTVRLLDSANFSIIDTTTTDVNGEYDFDHLNQGSYIIEVVPPGGSFFTIKDAGANNAVDSDVFPTTGRTPVIALGDGIELSNIDAGLISAPPAIEPDSFEPNDTIQTPHDFDELLGLNIFQSPTIHDDGAADIDFYVFDVAADSQAPHFVRIEFDHSDIDLDLRLFDENGGLLRSSTSRTNNEEISLAGLDNDRFIVQVFTFGQNSPVLGHPTGDYNLLINAPLLEVLADDDEVNDTPGTATVIGLVEGNHRRQDRTIDNARGVTDLDHYLFNISAPASPSHFVSIDFDDDFGDLDLRLFDPNDLSTPLRTSQGISDTELISLGGLGAGQYLIKINGFGGALGEYELNIEAPVVTVLPDGREVNDDIPGATVLGPIEGLFEEDNLTIHSNGNQTSDPDFFSFELLGRGTGDHFVEIEFLHGDGNLELELLDSNGAVIGQSFSVTDDERVSLNGRLPGQYFARVTGFSGAIAPYELTIEAPLAQLPPDALEDNDSFAAPTDLGLVQGSVPINDLTIHADNGGASNPDFFKFETLTAGLLSDFLVIGFDQSQGNLDLRLFADADHVNPIRQSTGPGNVESVSLLGLPAGVYFAKVDGFNDANAEYDLLLNAPIVTILPDALEPNDTRDAPRDLRGLAGTNFFPGLSIHPNNDNSPNPDFYVFQTVGAGIAGDHVTINHVGNPGAFSLILRQVDDADNSGTADPAELNAAILVDASAVFSDQQTVSLQGLPSGFYLIEIAGLGGSTGNYQMTIEAPLVPRVDAFEPNDNLDEATDLSGAAAVGELEIEDLFIHQNGDGSPNPDFFKFVLNQPGTASHFVKAKFSHEEGNLGMRLFREDSPGPNVAATLIAQVDSITNNELISLAGLAAGTYHVEIFGSGPSDFAEYDLVLRTPAPLAPDVFEVNDTQGTATDLRGLEGANRFDDLTIHQNPDNSFDEDWYQFDLQRTGGAAHFVALDFDHAAGNLNMLLRDVNGAPLDRAFSITDDEQITLQGLPVGTYFVEVFGTPGAGPGVTNEYDLIFQTPFAPVPPSPDFLEVNDNFGQATDLDALAGPFNQANLTIHDGADEDFFQFELQNTGGATDFLGINFLHSDGDLDLRLLASDGTTLLASALSATNNERISLDGLAQDTYFARVIGFGGATNNYELAIQAPLPAPLVTPDIYEPIEPLPITTSQIIAGLTIHDPALNNNVGTLQDVFNITTTAVGTSLDGVQIQNYSGQLAGPHWTLRTLGGSTVSQNTNPQGSSAISFNGLAAGDYVLTLERIGSDTFGYDLAVQLPTTTGPPADLYEPNDSAPAAATDLGELEGHFELNNQLTIHLDNTTPNPDLFRFILLDTGQATDQIEIEFLATDGDLNLELLAQDGTTVLDTGTPSNNGEQISFTGLERGVYFARVTGAGTNEAAPYNLKIEAPFRDTSFQITLDFSTSSQTLTQTQQDAFTNASNFWSLIITGDLPEVLLTAAQLGTANDRVIDDVLIQVNFENIDGPFGILGSAGPRLIRTTSLLPALGSMRLDTADIAFLESNNLLELVIRHEMAHVLGFGTLWGGGLMNLIGNSGTLDPRFVGTTATTEYETLFIVSEGSVPLENTGGPGTAEAHWRESNPDGSALFGSELLTGFLNAGNNPLSIVSVAAFQDMGYQVDLTAADIFVPPNNAPNTAALQGLQTFISTNSSTAYLGVGGVDFDNEDNDDPEQGDPLNVNGAGLDFRPDDFEASEAFALRENQTLSDLTIHDPALFNNEGTRIDTFTFTLPAEDGVARPSQKLTVQSEDADASITINLKDNGGNIVQTVTSSGDADNLMLLLEGKAAGDYSFEISGDLNRYDLVFNGLSTITGTQVVDRHVFYNNSDFDGDDVAANAADDNAIATNKQALLPGGQGNLDNITNFAGGINSLMIDIANPDNPGSITAADFEFRTGISGDPSTWALLGAAPLEVTVRAGDGTDNTSRISITFADGTIVQTWLQVTVKANANTGLAAADVFYFGNSIGESSDNPLNTTVNATDEIGARNNQRTFLDPATVVDLYDYNHDGFVNATDEILARNNQTTFLNRLALINPPEGSGGGNVAPVTSQQQLAANLVEVPDSNEEVSSADESTIDPARLLSLITRRVAATRTGSGTQSSLQLTVISSDDATTEDEADQPILDLVSSSNQLTLVEAS